MQRNRFGRRALDFARRALVGLTWLYCLLILYLTAVWLLMPQRFWLISLTNLFAPLFFLPLLALLPLAVLIRTRRMIVGAAIPLVLFVLLFGGLFIPRIPPLLGPTANLRILTFNQFFGNQRIDAVIAALRASEADVIALQELSPALASAIEGELGDLYPYRWLIPADNSHGIGLISKLPFSEHSRPLDGRAQRVSLALDSGPLTLVNVHLHFNSISRRSVEFWGDVPILKGYDSRRLVDQVDGLLADVADVQGRLVILGDFNLGDREPAYDKLRSALRDGFREAGWGFGFTFPNRKSFGPVTVPTPVVRLDYVWLRGPIAAQGAHVDCRQVGADHCMLRVDLRLS